VATATGRLQSVNSS